MRVTVPKPNIALLLPEHGHQAPQREAIQVPLNRYADAAGHLHKQGGTPHCNLGYTTVCDNLHGKKRCRAWRAAFGCRQCCCRWMLARMTAKQTGKAWDRQLVLESNIAHPLPALLKSGDQCRDLRRTAPPPLNRKCADWLVHTSSQPPTRLSGKNGLARSGTDQLHIWLDAQLDESKTEPNSGLGQAINYLLRHW
jgi:hypothetical protein